MKRVFVLLAAAALAAGCSSGKEGDASANAAAPAKPPVAVELLTVAPRTLEEGVDVVGTLAPKYEAAVRAELRTRIEKVHVTQWVNVAKGQPLAESDTRDLDVSLGRAKAAVEAALSQEAAARSQVEGAKSQEASANAGLLEAKVGAERGEREYQRLLKLKESGLATQQGLDEGLTARDAAAARVTAVHAQIEAARAQVRAASAQAEAAKAQVEAARGDVLQLETQLAKAVIRSPLNGTVAERTVNVGDLPGDAVIFHIVDTALLDLTVSVPSRSIASVKPGQPLHFSSDAFPGETFAGKVMFVNPAADPADRSVRVTAEVPNVPARLKGGLFVKGRIVTGSRSGALLVPRNALLSWDVASGKAELFVESGGTAKKRQVRTGAANGDEVEVTSGLSAGESVVTRGAFNVKDGDPVAAAPKGAG